MASNTQGPLFGQEVEYGLAITDPRGRRINNGAGLGRMLHQCSRRIPYLQGGGDRMYLANGGLLYPDVGHPEYATAECTDPVSLLKSLRAGEQLLTEGAASLAGDPDIGSVSLFRTTVDYHRLGVTWGAHESYLSRRPPRDYAAFVVPHLVSRIVYTGVGGFDNRRRGATFTLSPRTGHLTRPVGRDTTGSRAIFSLRDEPLAGGELHRVHLICGEANCCELVTYLKFGATALVQILADAGIDLGVGNGWLEAPVTAMNRVARDTSCRERAMEAGGVRQTAISVQRHYLEVAEAYVDATFMPEWAPELCRRWRAVLDALAANPESLVGELDWPTKLALFRQHTRRRGTIPWEALPIWEDVLARAAQALDLASDKLHLRWIRAALRPHRETALTLQRLAEPLADQGCDWRDLDAFLALRDELCELDLRFGQLYPRGIYLQLEDAGTLAPGLLRPADAEAAQERAPEPGRARTRGDWIRRLAGDGNAYLCDWASISTADRRLDLGDPFLTAAEWQPKQSTGRQRSGSDAQLELLQRRLL